MKERACQESLCGKYGVWRGGEVESVEKEWEKFRDMVMECPMMYVAFMRHVGGQRRKRSEWWNKKVGGWWPKREELLRNGYREEIGMPMTDTKHRVVVKRPVKVAKRMPDWRWGERL